ncbi:hypothetical protein F441_16382, partial [Phytophthora nicotianae CJ01A1]
APSNAFIGVEVPLDIVKSSELNLLALWPAVFDSLELSELRGKAPPLV